MLLRFVFVFVSFISNRALTVKQGAKKIPLYTIHINPSNKNEFAVGGRDKYLRSVDLHLRIASNPNQILIVWWTLLLLHICPPQFLLWHFLGKKSCFFFFKLNILKLYYFYYLKYFQFSVFVVETKHYDLYYLKYFQFSVFNELFFNTKAHWDF